jgi:hypothetical protein
MELLSIATARSVWLFDINELNPRGKSIFPELLEWLQEEYHFAKAPKSLTDVDETEALAFSQGTFQVREEIFVDVELKVYRDGLVANTWSSTRETDVFLGNVLNSAAEEFSLAYKPEMVRRKMYLSEINVRSPKEIAAINPRLYQFANKIKTLLPSNGKTDFEPAGVMIAPVQDMSPTSIAAFRFERKNGTSPDEHKFYSVAPLHTDDHLELLKDFEILLMGDNRSEA